MYVASHHQPICAGCCGNNIGVGHCAHWSFHHRRIEMKINHLNLQTIMLSSLWAEISFQLDCSHIVIICVVLYTSPLVAASTLHSRFDAGFDIVVLHRTCYERPERLDWDAFVENPQIAFKTTSGCGLDALSKNPSSFFSGYAKWVNK